MSAKFFLIALVLGGAAMAADDQASPTFSNDVLPILQKNCQTCHSPRTTGLPCLTKTTRSLQRFRQTRWHPRLLSP